jgi:hypothetical protein
LRLLMNSSRSLRWVAAGTSGSLGLAKWLFKPPKPLVPGAKGERGALDEHDAGEVE